MKIVLASGNKGKIAEFKKLMPNDNVLAFKELIGNYEVEEDRDSFQGNAIKKAQEIYEKIGDENIVVISDDSGITVPLVNNEPGIYSARYAGENASDKDNNKN
jgi:XTP/dITP diphosphohydrolase